MHLHLTYIMRGYSAYLSMSMSANTQYYTLCTHVLASTYLYYS